MSFKGAGGIRKGRGDSRRDQLDSTTQPTSRMGFSGEDPCEGGFGLLPIIFVMVIFYFLLIRPQQKRAKQHKEMLAAIRRGDKIVTSGGLMGTVVKVIDDNDTVEVEIAKDVKVSVVRGMIADIRGKTEPVKK